QTPTPPEIVSALSRTGFILEHRVAQKLRGAEFETDINRAYPDPETGKSREIDVFASKADEIKRTPASISLEAELIIECKSSSNPFVLIGEAGQDRVYWDKSVLLSFDPLALNFPGRLHKRVRYELDLEKLPGSRKQEDFTG